MTYGLRAALALGVAAILAGTALTGCTSAPPRVTAAPAGLPVAVSRGSCGPVWHAAGGTRTFQVTNRDIVTTGVDLIDPVTTGVYAEIESLAPNATRPMRVQLGRGAYAFRCYPEDSDAVTGPTVTVTTGSTDGSPAVLPISEQDLTGALTAYSAYVTGGLRLLATDTTALRAALARGDRAAAESAWLTAHLDYNRLGAAYDTFGDAGDAIDGLPDGLPGGVADPGFTGLHRIEYGLWHDQPMPVLAALGTRLVAAVASLRVAWPREQIDPNDLPLRAHEILENALQFQLTGAADQGSGTSLATALADVDGTQHVLDALAPLMAPRDTGWSRIAPAMATARAALGAARRPGGWIPVARLTTAQRERIDAAISGLLEILAPIATIGDVRRRD